MFGSHLEALAGDGSCEFVLMLTFRGGLRSDDSNWLDLGDDKASKIFFFSVAGFIESVSLTASSFVVCCDVDNICFIDIRYFAYWVKFEAD